MLLNSFEILSNSEVFLKDPAELFNFVGALFTPAAAGAFDEDLRCLHIFMDEKLLLLIKLHVFY